LNINFVMEVKMIVKIEEIIKEEKYDVELKQKVNFDNPKDYLKTVSSFANGYNVGYIIFGIENSSKKVIGINNVKKSYEDILNRIILVKIIPGDGKPYYCKKWNSDFIH